MSKPKSLGQQLDDMQTFTGSRFATILGLNLHLI